MSASPSMSASPVMPTDALAATQRVQQLQTLLAQARQGSSTASFAAALAAASAGPESGQGAAASTPSAQSPTLATASGPQSTTLAAASSPQSATLPAVAPTEAAAGNLSTAAEAAIGANAPASGNSAMSSGNSGSSAYDATISQVATRYGLDPAVLHGLIQQESGFNPSARSSAGALGLTQLMPSTAASLGVSEPLNPTQSIEGGARYLSEMLTRFGGNTADALAAYNAGPGAVEQYGGVPPYAETQEYVSKVLANANAYRSTAPVGAPA